MVTYSLKLMGVDSDGMKVDSRPSDGDSHSGVPCIDCRIVVCNNRC